MPLNPYPNELSASYKLLSAILMQEPDDEMLQRLSEEFDLTFNDSPGAIIDDFRRIFYGPDAVSPLESLYDLSSMTGPHTWSRKTDDVVSFYESCGLILDDGLSVPPDHIAVEFLFVSYLFENRKIAELKRFFSDHILKWVPFFCELMERAARTEFYKEIARITRDIVLSDYEELKGEGKG